MAARLCTVSAALPGKPLANECDIERKARHRHRPPVPFRGMKCDTVPMEDETGGLRLRYWLHRDLASAGREGLVFVMLNPSTADAVTDDATIRRCVGFGRQWGYRELTVVNLFALRATKPADLRRHGTEAVGEHNDDVLRWMRQHPATSMVVAAWGNQGTHLGRDAAAMAIIAPTQALGVTKQGCPKHPLYVRSSAKPLPYRRRSPVAIKGACRGRPFPSFAPSPSLARTYATPAGDDASRWRCWRNAHPSATRRSPTSSGDTLACRSGTMRGRCSRSASSTGWRIWPMPTTTR